MLHADGSHQGFHYWNRFAGIDVDLTRRELGDVEVVQPPHLIERLPAFPWRAQAQYVIFLATGCAALRLRLTID